ncbi:MAG: nucleotidyltransferase family protein [Betaproteobacteria bacterium]|nr:nucleotidyltransferase family protein [Betaproteobacteria bacterium]
MNWAAVLLAAGAGSRMGHRPKSLLLLDGEPLICRHVQHLQQAGAASVVVVLGHYATDIGAVLQGLSVQTVHNPQPDDGLVSSQRWGLQVVPETSDGVLMMLADQPLLDAADITVLIKAFAARPAGIDMVFPKVGQQPGNPVMLSNAARSAILAQGPDVGCKEWRQVHPAQVQALVSANPHYTIDLDQPQDVVAFRTQTGRSLCWPDGWPPT